MEKIKSFEVKNLHKRAKNIKIVFSDNTLILVGENGSGKTTILKLFYYFLSGQFDKFSDYSFDTITLEYDEKSIEFTSEEISLYRAAKNNYLNRFSYEKSFTIDIDEESIVKSVHDFNADFPLSLSQMRKFIRKVENNTIRIDEFISKELKSFSPQVLYLPTYRRIEQEIGAIFKDAGKASLKESTVRHVKDKVLSCVELIEFGMNDVQRYIDSSLMNLNRFARINLNRLSLEYLDDIIEEKYEEVDLQQIINISDDMIKDVLKRIQNNFLSRKNKEHLTRTICKIKKSQEITSHDRVVCHYFIKVLKIQKTLQKHEENISAFCNVCNEYMVDKYFVYSPADFSLKILQRQANKESILELQQLSSGEKQIVSLFSHLYLSGSKEYFVIIDEPELSLSVEWQRKFLLDIKKGHFCKGLFAVTHSPFTYDNALKPFAHAIGEFVERG